MGRGAGPWGAKLSVSMAMSAACPSLLGQPPARQAVWEKAAGVEQYSSHVALAPTPTWHGCCHRGAFPTSHTLYSLSGSVPCWMR